MAVKAKDLSIKSLAPRATDYEVSIVGHRGLVVRVHPSGERTYRLRYRQDGVLKRVALGATTLDQARIEWMKLKDKVKLGDDPAATANAERAAKALKRQADRAALTVAELGQEFIERYAKRKKRTWHADQGMLEGAVNPTFGAVLARDIKRRDVIDLVDRIAAHAPVQANRVLAVLRKMYAWAREQEIVETTPCAGIKPPGAEMRRDRVLTDAELQTLWNYLPEAAAAADLQSVIKLQLLTGQRVGEVVGAKWREFDLKKAEWTIPGERTKNGRPNLVPLASDALSLVEVLERNGEFVFARRGTTGHLRVDVAGHELGEAVRALELEPFGTHDLRRTVATRLAELRIPRVVIDSLLNHVDRSVGAIYDRHNYAEEKRAALEAWAGKLSQIVSGKKSTVTPLWRLERHRA